MGKQLNIGVTDKARKGKKAYWGVNNLARKIKKMYIGVAGVARLFFSGGMQKISNAQNLPWASYDLYASKIGNYALFGSGQRSSANGGQYNNVISYNASLVNGRPSVNLGGPARMVGRNNKYCIFARARRYNAYDSSLVLTNKENSAFLTSGGLTGGFTPSSAIYSGAYYDSDESTWYGTLLYAISTTLAFTSNTTQGHGRLYPMVASVGNRVIFFSGGPSIAGLTAPVTAYDASLVKTNLPVISGGAVHLGAGASIGDKYALFAGGLQTGGIRRNEVLAYNESFVRSTLSPLTIGRYYLAGAGTDEYALFAGGCGTNSLDRKNTVDCYDDSLVKINDIENLSEVKYAVAGSNIGNRILFAGGFPETALVEVYES